MHGLRSMRGIAGSSLAALAVGIAGCGNTATNVVNHVSEEGPPAGVVVGEPTTVGFRADALGAARDLPVPVGTDSINGAMVTLSGTLHKATADWIVIDDTSADQRHWIRIESINWIRQPIPQEPAPSAATPA